MAGLLLLQTDLTQEPADPCAEPGGEPRTVYALRVRPQRSGLLRAGFLLSDLGELGASYLPFACVWIGYCLLASGLWLLCELTVSHKVYTQIYFGLAAALMAVLALLEWTLDLSLVGRMAELAQSYGAVLAVFSVLAGAAAFALMSRVTIRRLETRDLSV